MPERIQLRRTKGWRKPEGAVVVTRGPGRVFGNPFTIADAREAGWRGTDAELRAHVVRCFRQWLRGSDRWWQGKEADARRAAILAGLPELRGRDLCCWCPPGQPCHADVLLEMANQESG